MNIQHTQDINKSVRLQKILANAGFASRRHAERMITESRVEVDGKIVNKLGIRVNPHQSIIRVDGLRVIIENQYKYLAFNKPRGVLSTMHDTKKRPCIGDYLKLKESRLYHVGRLDSETEGLIFLTNNGEFAHRLTHPSFEIPKTYIVQIKNSIDYKVGKKLTSGVELDDGIAKFDSFKIIDSFLGKTNIEVILHSGRNRIIRRMFEEVGYPIERLIRTKIGPIAIGQQKVRKIRNLSKEELGQLFSLLDM